MPKRTFNKTVNEILAAEYKGKIASVPCEFSSAKVTGEHHYRLIIRDQKALVFLRKFEWGDVTENIKKVIRKHIKKNKESPKYANYELVVTLFKKLNVELNLATDRTVGEDYRYMRLQNAYREVIEKTVSAIENCFANDENQGDINLSALDCRKIVNGVFEKVFPKPEIPEEYPDDYWDYLDPDDEDY
ncbi:MAG: hypothetical protein ACI4F7_04500 [Acutalibacteraceae bacterium]